MHLMILCGFEPKIRLPSYLASLAVMVIFATQNTHFSILITGFSIDATIDHLSHSLLSFDIFFQCIFYCES
jgi:hypothetical protein